MAENSLVDSGFKGMSCSMPVNSFKAGNHLHQSVSSVDSSMHVKGPGWRFQSAGPFASPLDPSVHGSSASHQFHSKNLLASVSQQDTYSIDLFTHRPKLNKPIKNPADYDGTRLLCDYLKHFERCSVVNGWNQEAAALFLAAGL